MAILLYEKIGFYSIERWNMYNPYTKEIWWAGNKAREQSSCLSCTKKALGSKQVTKFETPNTQPNIVTINDITTPFLSKKLQQYIWPMSFVFYFGSLHWECRTWWIFLKMSRESLVQWLANVMSVYIQNAISYLL